ncbi:MAG: hypothetical protein HY092_01210 [Candidatus Kerfeldbacteria bacterium]|nr:hypothetical protein [Candidatus Kerfeldbacteria bacterium]
MLKLDEAKIAREKLFESHKHLPPGTPDDVHDFCNCLSFRVKPDLAPLRFIRDTHQLLNDLPFGHDRDRAEPMIGRLIGREPRVYAVLRESVPNIVTHLFPAGFASDVLRLLSRIESTQAVPATA